MDGISTEEMSKEQLEEHIVRLREELDREREERNYFQLERDKVTTFWEITKRQHEEKKAELRNKDREMEEAEERHQVEIKVYKQKVKHLLYEHQNNIAELKAESKCNILYYWDFIINFKFKWFFIEVLLMISYYNPDIH